MLSVVGNIPPSTAEIWFDANGSLDDVLKARQDKSEELVAKAGALLNAKGITAETAVRRGRVRKAMAAEAKPWPASAVIVDSKSLRGIRATEGKTQSPQTDDFI